MDNIDKDIMVSVVVLTYNHVNYIEKALDSVLMQKTSFSYEILIGDDASTDGTSLIVKQYQEKYPDIIKAYVREKNLGATRNGYELLLKSKGRYIAACEGDDYWTSSCKLQKQVEFLENNLDFIGTCHRFSTIDNDGNSIKHKVNWIKHKKIFTLNDFKGIYHPSQLSTFVRRNIYLDKSQDYSCIYKIDRMIGDRTELLLYLSKGNYYCFDEKMGVYRVASASSITQSKYKKNRNAIESDLELTEKLELLAKELTEVTVDFMPHRKELYVSAFIRCIRTRRFTSEDIETFKKIRGKCKKIVFWTYIPVGICERIIREIKND